MHVTKIGMGLRNFNAIKGFNGPSLANDKRLWACEWTPSETHFRRSLFAGCSFLTNEEKKEDIQEYSKIRDGAGIHRNMSHPWLF
jgi:hypothetical protein